MLFFLCPQVKITNLNYATSAETLARACEVIGPVINVNLILDEYRNSTGRAFVVFADDDTAQHFVDRMNEQTLDGRVIRVSLSTASASKSKRKDGGGGMKKENRYWEKDISKKCNHCGIVGHTMNNCPNGDDQFKPCPLCAEVGHQMYSCPLKSVCFNCGIPGHVSRECNYRRLEQRRIICTICHSRHHHRTHCNERPWNISAQDAVCMECGKVGHLMCSDMKWFFGLTGMTCFNCGGNDHSGIQCKRPNVDQCAKNPGLAQQEIERADAINL
jgi:cellular nucleic acid-binding protein